MNNQDRKQLASLKERMADLIAKLESLHEDATALADAEQEKFDNMSEGLACSEKGVAIETAANNLAELAAAVESAKDSLQEAADMEVEE
jgi:hypothetical protein